MHVSFQVLDVMTTTIIVAFLLFLYFIYLIYKYLVVTLMIISNIDSP